MITSHRLGICRQSKREVCCRCLKLQLLFFVALVCTSPVAAQLLDDTVPTVKKAQHRSSFTFQFKSPISAVFAGSKVKLPAELKQNTDIALPTFLYPLSDRNPPPGVGTFDGLPACQKNQIRDKPIFNGEPAFSGMDIVVYQAVSQEQAALAKRSTLVTFPYIEGAMSNPYRDPQDFMQGRIRLLGLECLPTRIVETHKDGQSMLEYREGSDAWK